MRRGEPSALLDLEQGRPKSAKNIVILRPDEPDVDAEVVKSVLAVMKSREGLSAIPIVAEFADPVVAKAIRQAMPGMVTTVVSGEVVARVAAQTSRAAGLGAVFEDLLDFAGDEVYITPVPGHLAGRSFGDALLSSDDCTVIGIVDSDGVSRSCPDFQVILSADQQLIILAADDSSINFRDYVPTWIEGQSSPYVKRPARVEAALIIGWNDFVPRILNEMDHQVAPGSRVDMLVESDVGAIQAQLAEVALVNQAIHIAVGSAIDRDVVSDAISRGPFEHVMVLCAHDGRSALEADARALLALLHVRACLNDHQGESNSTNVVTEVLHAEAVDLAQVAHPDDFIVSQRLVSLLIAQLAEHPGRKPVLQDLLAPGGTQVVLLPAHDFLATGSYTFEDVVTALRSRGVMAIGWRLRDVVSGREVMHAQINPPKTMRVTLADQDQIVAILR